MRTDRENDEQIEQFFTYEHLPPRLAAVSKPFCDLARVIINGSETAAALPANAERTAALRKLLEAKDCAVRALLSK
jgi:hypothetical protein